MASPNGHLLIGPEKAHGKNGDASEGARMNAVRAVVQIRRRRQTALRLKKPVVLWTLGSNMRVLTMMPQRPSGALAIVEAGREAGPCPR